MARKNSDEEVVTSTRSSRRAAAEAMAAAAEPVKKGRTPRGSREVAPELVTPKLSPSYARALSALDEQLDVIEKDYGLTSSSVDNTSARVSTGMLSLDIILARGLVPGWYTIFGPEQSCKSTGATTLIAAALNTDVPVIQWWDFEGSSSGDYIASIMRVNGIKTDVNEIFGIRNPKTQQWEVPPRVRYYSEGVAEKFFDSLAKLERILPDKVMMNDKWYLVYPGKIRNSQGKEVTNKAGLAVVKDDYDKNYFRKTGNYRIEVDNDSLQALIILDSYPAMLPEKQDVDDPNSAIGVQARMFSDQLKRVKGKLRAKRIAVVGINQLRLKPMVMFGCFHGSSKIVMADGTQRAIRDIVREKSKDKVLSFNTRTGKVEARKVVGWFENGTTDSWLQFKCNGVNTGNGLSQFRCTPNHLLLGADGIMRPAGEYTVGQQLMANSYQPALSKDQQQVVLGSIIGDGYFLGKGGERFGISHNEHQVDYLRWKEEVFGQHAGTFYEGSGYTRANGVHVGMHHMEIKQIKDPWFKAQFKEHREGISGQGYRIGTLAEKLDLLGVAVWVMDDGIKSSGKNWFVKTCSISLLERNNLVKVLNKRLGLGLRSGNMGEDIGVVITEKAMARLVPYMHPQFGDVLKSAYPRVSFLKLGTYKVAKVDTATYGAPATITGIAQTSNMTGKDTEGRSIYDKVKYDIEVEGCHTYCVNGVFVHNSPEYEPAGEAVKFFSDCRLKFTPRALSAIPGAKGKGYIEEEDSIEGSGVDTYRYIHVRAIKNKLSTPNIEGWLRLWITNADGEGCGFDPVYDTYWYLTQTGQVTGKRNCMKIALEGRAVSKSLSWMDFKTMVLGTTKEIRAVCESAGMKPLRIRAFCTKQLSSGEGLDMYYHCKKENRGKTEEDDEAGDDE